MEPQVLMGSSIAHSMGSWNKRVVKVPNRAACLQGRGTHIDYILAEASIAGITHVEVAPEALWRPHLSLDVMFPCRPRAL
eukprot:5617876-Lingulodinium_polyedra.AAC.1